MSILEGEIAEIVSDGLEAADVPYDITITRKTPGSTQPPYTAWNRGPPTIADHPCRGWVDDYSARQRDGTIIKINDRKVIILVPSLEGITPTADDIVTAQGQYTVISVKHDPASATYELQVRA